MSEPFERGNINLPIPLNNAPQDNPNYDVPFDTGGESSITETSREPPDYKPYPFALRPCPVGEGEDEDEEGIHIYFGVLVHQINRMVFDSDGLVSQAGVNNPQVIIPSNLSSAENRYKYYRLNWRGDVYLYWETTSSGSVTLCELKGPEAPEQQGLPNDAGGKFYVKIGTVAAGDEGYDIPSLDQNISTDVYWVTAFAENQGAGNGGSDSGSSSTSDSGSDKSTAIVPMDWHDEGYGALFTMESNEVLFEFVMRDVPVVGPKTVTRIDDRFLAVCEQDSMTITGVAGDRAGSVGAVVEENNVILSAWPLSFLRPKKVTLKLTGVRKGFKHLDMPERSREQFIANEKFINSAYPRK
tara:strand:+ start:466 stop:1530 length:1065 start_codon:yes stop_codon:yes gene_type:complete